MDRDTLVQTIYATFAAPYGEYITPALRQQLTICAGQAADRVLAKINTNPATVRPDTALDRNRRMQAAYEAGASLQEIADEHGISRQRVHQVLSRLGVVMRPTGRIASEIDPNALADAYNSGSTVASIAERFSVSPSTIRKALERQGFQVKLPRKLFNSVDERDAWVASSYEDGFTTAEIGVAIGLAQLTVTKILREQGVKVRHGGTRIDHERDRQVAEMYEAGMTILDIAERVGISGGAVSLALNRQGVKARPRGGQRREQRARTVKVMRGRAA